MIERLLRFGTLVLTAMMLSSCANEPFARSSAVRIDYGRVEAIEICRGSDSKPINIGTVRPDSGSTVIVEDSRDVETRVGDGVRVENDRVFRV